MVLILDRKFENFLNNEEIPELDCFFDFLVVLIDLVVVVVDDLNFGVDFALRSRCSLLAAVIVVVVTVAVVVVVGVDVVGRLFILLVSLII